MEFGEAIASAASLSASLMYPSQCLRILAIHGRQTE
jgi:hypothetical protein